MSETERVHRADVDRSTEMWSALAIHVDVAICLLDRTGTIREVTAAIEGVTGFGPDHYRGTNVVEHVHRGDVAAFVSQRRDLMDLADGARRRFRFRLATPGGPWHWVEAVATRQLDQPDVEGFVVSIRDVDEEHRATEELRSSERQARTLIADLEKEEVFLRLLLDAALRCGDGGQRRPVGPVGQPVDRTGDRLVAP